MTHQDDGNLVLLGILHKFSGDLANLRHRSRGRVHFALKKRLNGIHQNKLRLYTCNRLKDRGGFRFT